MDGVIGRFGGVLGAAQRTSARASTGASQAFDQVGFTNRLEKHLDDVAAGLGNLSPGVDTELLERQLDTSDSLAHQDPAALRHYSGYLSELRYDRGARFVGAVQLAVSSLDSIPTEEESKAAVEELLKKLPQPSSKAATRHRTVQDEILGRDSEPRSAEPDTTDGASTTVHTSIIA